MNFKIAAWLLGLAAIFLSSCGEKSATASLKRDAKATVESWPRTRGVFSPEELTAMEGFATPSMIDAWRRAADVQKRYGIAFGKKLNAELQKPPYLGAWDYFSGTYQGFTSYEIASVSEKNGHGDVDVDFSYIRGSILRQPYEHFKFSGNLDLKLEGEVWKLDNITWHDGRNMRDFLEEHVRVLEMGLKNVDPSSAPLPK